ncbi:MAG: carboxypeptidase regulatory-like domain-containing protein [Pirellulaceae bacterium]|nr:carboxypeptidase regulatory-like domain-containing protein [Pirellulaceae bacterium]
MKRFAISNLPVGHASGSRRLFLRTLGALGLGLLTIGLSFSSGCGGGDGLNRKPLSGAVTVDGAPVPNGSVNFEPLFEGGIGGGAVISEGKYAIAKADGLPPGKYRVRITGDDGKNFEVGAGKMPGDEIMPPKKELVPASWNAKSQKEIEVTDDGPFVFDFPISSKDK